MSAGEMLLSSLETQIWITRNQIRLESLASDGSSHDAFIFQDRLNYAIYLDLKTSTYKVFPNGVDKRYLRRSFRALTPVINGFLQSKPEYVTSKRQKQMINGFFAQAYSLNLSPGSGLQLDLWAYSHSLYNQSHFKRLLYSYLGSGIPRDVDHLIRTILKDIEGVPIRVSATVSVEQMALTLDWLLAGVEMRTLSDEELFKIPVDFVPIQLESH